MNGESIFTRIPVSIAVIAYLAVYFAASWMDLVTTSLGLTKPGVSEKNVLTLTGTGYSPGRAWFLTAAGGIVLVACILESFRSSRRVSEHWLRHPVRSFGKFYIHPWSERAIGFTPIHFLSLAIAFLLLRVLAALNNLAVYWYGIGPIGELMEMVASKTSPLIGFSLVGFWLFVGSTLVVSPVAARLIRCWRKISEPAICPDRHDP